MSATDDLLAQIFADDISEVSDVELKPHLKFSIPRGTLSALLDKAITVIPTRDVMPVLKCFQFQVDPQRLRIIASDIDRTLIVSNRDVSVSWPGVAVFPAKRLLSIVKSADNADVHITVTGVTGHIRIGRASWSLQLQGGYDYPGLPAITDAEFVSVDKDVFSYALNTVRYAASRDINRADLAVVDISGGKLTASDGSRVQQIRISDFPVDIRIPIDAVDDLLQLIKHTGTETIHVGQSDHKLIFRLGSDALIISKVNATFPDMESIVLRPALENKRRLVVSRGDMLGAIKRVRVNSDPDSSAVALVVEDNTLTVTAKDKFGNTADEQIDCTWDGPARILVVDHRHLTSLMQTCPDFTCTFLVGDDTKTRRAPLLLMNDTSVGVAQQMQDDWGPR